MKKNNLKDSHGIYTLAHGFPLETELAKYVAIITATCRKRGVTGTEAKLGTHLTAIPPFFETHEKIMFAAACMKAATMPIHSWEATFTVSGIGYFGQSNIESKTDAIYLSAILPEKYYEYLSQMKASKTFNWVHTLVRSSAVEPILIPHVLIFEGKNLIKRILPFEEKLNNIVSGRTFLLPPPQFFRKNLEGGKSMYWERVIPW